MPVVATVHILLDADDKRSGMNTLCRVMTLAMSLGMNGIMGWDATPLEVDDVPDYALEDMQAGSIERLISAARRH